MKNVKDPIYGYIEIKEEYFDKIIDTPSFQRLRNIRQTGYQSLYPSALHNRFVHSLGVFYLGKKGFEYLRKNTHTSYPSQDWAELENTFLLACLIHDIGHSPFSHTGEYYYNKSIDFNIELSKLIKSEEFTKEICNKSCTPHEAMSVLVGLPLCESFSSFNKELFARAIIGLPYSSTDKTLMNAIIGLLNGNIIDVDKLDYLIRDSYVTGYSNMAIDYERLLSGYTICNYNGVKKPGYKKCALSVIENVIFANDLERRWIQNNPIILYDCKIIDLSIRKYNSYMQKTYGITSVFILPALSDKGLEGIPLSLLCDDDVVTYIKNIDKTPIAQQYFDRKKRLKPAWKTEVEFESIVSGEFGESIKHKFQADLESVTDSLDDSFFINVEAKKEAQRKLQDAQDLKMNDENAEYLIKSYEKICNIINLFEKYTVEDGKDLDFQFAVLFADKFTSSYRNLEFEKMYISLSDSRTELLQKYSVVRAVEERSEMKLKLFYIYTTERNLQRCPKLGEEIVDFMRRNYKMCVL